MMNAVSRRLLLHRAGQALLAAGGAGSVTTGCQSLGVASTGVATGPLVIGHRGASGYRPEHTLAAYELAIDQGAHFIEPDLVMSQDGELIARHEPVLARVELNADHSIRLVQGKPVIHRSETTTNVWQLPRYADRLQVKTLNGRPVGGWWAEDFSSAELRADVRAQERLRDVRTGNTAYDDREVLPTLQEVIALAKRRSGQRVIGIYPETKHPSFFLKFTQSRGLPRMEDKLLSILHTHYANHAAAPVFVQSFEVSSLQYMAARTQLRLVQLLSARGQPYDFTLAGDKRTYADLARPGSTGLNFIASYADGIGANTDLMIPSVEGRLGTPTRLVHDAHAAGLLVHGWTFRAENQFLPAAHRHGASATALGDMKAQLQAFLALGMDGFFTDQPDLGLAAVAAAPKVNSPGPASAPLRRQRPLTG